MGRPVSVTVRPSSTVASGQSARRSATDAVMALDKRYRVPVLLYYYEGYSQKEIAEMLAVPEETVRTRLFRARGKLKTSLTEVLQYD